MEGVHPRDDHSGGEEGAFGRVGNLSGQHAVLDMAAEGMKEVGGRGPMGGHGKVHLGGDDFIVVGPQSRVVEVPDVNQKHGGTETVAMFDEVAGGIRELLADPLEVDAAGVVAGLHRQVVAPGEGGADEAAGVPAFRAGEHFPELFVTQGVDAFDPCFAPLAALGHALGGFQGVNIVAVHPSVGHAHTFLERNPMRHVKGGHPAGDREGGSGKEGEVEPLGILHHLHALLPVGGEVLVIEYGDTAAGFFEDLDAFLKPVVAGVELLAFLIVGIVTVLGNDDHPIDRELARAEGECLLIQGWVIR